MEESSSEDDDLLVPGFDSELRESTFVPATFNLVATIVGGGVLTLPLTFQKCGILLATVLMVVAAIVTDLSLYILCLAARRTGAATYGQVSLKAFGKNAEYFVSGLIFVYLVFCLVAFMVLVRDIWTPIVGLVMRSEAGKGNLVLLSILVLIAPFVVQKNLHALRYNCYIEFASLSVLCCAFYYRAWSEWVDESTNNESTLLYMTTNFEDVLFAFPIIILTFLSHFNVLPIQNALVRPTKARVRSLVDAAVFAAFLLMYLFGLGGYLCFRNVQGNILLNLSNDDNGFIFAGRVGCGLTIMLAIPMVALPCRRNMLEVMDCWMEPRTQSQLPIEHIPVTDETPLIYSLEEQVCLAESTAAHYGSTLLIMAGCYLGAVVAPEVAIVWNLSGSFMAFLIGFILPSACFLRIQSELSRQIRAWEIFSWCLLMVSIAAAFVCASHTTYLLIGQRHR